MSFQLLGGIGLFLLGMVLLTDGLKAYAGEALRAALLRFTGTPYKAFSSGALFTLLVQSSSATTVTLIGFVSAGLITFPQAIGVLFGASLGTTGTGWVVSVLGLEVNLGFYALPLVGVGALMRLLGHGGTRSLGLALAGFGLIFIGIDTLQEGMRILASRFDLAGLPAVGWSGYLAVMAIGIVMTVVMQSSSAAVATTMTALHTQVINFDQAAVLVIGAAIGTTVSAIMAAIGGTVPAKRTALMHVLFNLASGLIALALLPGLLWALALAQRHLGLEPGAVSLAAFHTAFIALGVALFLPFAERLARLMERLLPEKGPGLTSHLDDSLLSVPEVALEATRRTLSVTGLELLAQIDSRLWPTPNAGNASAEVRLAEVRAALEQTQHFFARIPALADDQPMSGLRITQLHAIDHLAQLAARVVPPAQTQQALGLQPLQEAINQTRASLALARQVLQGQAPSGWQAEMQHQSESVLQQRQAQRLSILHSTAAGGSGPLEAMAALDALRWLELVSYRAWRACHYLALADLPQASSVTPQAV